MTSTSTLIKPMPQVEQLSQLVSLATKAGGVRGPAWGHTVEWTWFDGGKEAVSVAGCKTPAEARRVAFAMAEAAGWTASRWWQWWRWGDTPNAGIKG